MSRPALWRSTAAHTADRTDGGIVPHPPPEAPTVDRGAPEATLPPRSAERPRLDQEVQRFERIAALHAELAEAYRGLARDSQDQLAVPQERALMSSVKPARLLSVRDVAGRLGLSERTVRRQRRSGRLPTGIEIAGVIRWTPESIEAWIAAGGRS